MTVRQSSQPKTLLPGGKSPGLWRRWVGRLIPRMFSLDVTATLEETDAAVSPTPTAALKASDESRRAQIEENGVVGGLKRKIKGVADDYVREKLDEIESRIDRKLDQIDARLGEWRDREIRNRVRIIKLTLLASIVVALLSLGYDHIKGRLRTDPDQTPARDVRR